MNYQFLLKLQKIKHSNILNLSDFKKTKQSNILNLGDFKKAKILLKKLKRGMRASWKSV